MPLINLIQEQRMLVKAGERRSHVLLMASVGIGALAFLGAGYFTFEASRLNAAANTLEQLKAKLEPTMKLVDANNAEIGKLKPRLETLEQAQKNTEKWTQILQHLTKNTPSGTWLTAIKAAQQDKTKPLIVTVNGLSGSLEAVGMFQLRLEACEQLENASLKYTQERMGDGGKQIEFEIQAELVGSKPAEKPKENTSA